MTGMVFVERRLVARSATDQYLLDLHHGLERRHNELDGRVGMISTSVMQLAEGQANNHREVMAEMKRVRGELILHDAKDAKNDHMHMLVWFCVLTMLVILTIRSFW